MSTSTTGTRFLLAFAVLAILSGLCAAEVIIRDCTIDITYNADGSTAIAEETIVFINTGHANHIKDLCVAIPHDSVVVSVRNMTHQIMDTSTSSIPYAHNGETLCWNATIAPISMEMYTIMYATPITESGEFVKNLDPAITGYQVVSFRLHVDTDDSIKIYDENGDEIDQSDVEAGYYTWSSGVPFKEIHVVIEPSESSFVAYLRYIWEIIL